jgi:hypothetical protein
MVKPLWQSSQSGFNSVGGGFASRGATPARPYQPKAPYVPGSAGQDAGNTPGTYNINLGDPAGTIGQTITETDSFFAGLKAAIFGTDIPDAQGKTGGLLGDVPGLGALGRFASEATANVAGAGLTALKGAVDVVGGGLEHIPMPGEDDVRQMFDALPADSEAKQKAEEAILSSTGPIGPAVGNIMAQAVREHQEAITSGSTDLDYGLFYAPASAADYVNNLFGVLGWGQRRAERLIAGAAKPGTGDMNRLQAILAVGDGQVAWSDPLPGDQIDTTLNPVEQITYDKFKSGEWTETEALDFLSSHGAGLAHSAWLQIAGTIASDPLNAAALGSATLARGSLTAIRAAEAASRAEGALTTLRAPGTSATWNLLGRAAEREGVTNIMKAWGQVYSPLAQGVIGKTAKGARYVIDPLHAIDLKLPGQARMVDATTDIVTRSGVEAMGPGNFNNVIESMHGASPALMKQFTDDFQVYMGNLGRRVIGNGIADKNLAASSLDIETLKTITPDQAIEDVIRQQPRSIQQLVKQETARHRMLYWTAEEDANLARRLSKAYGVFDEGEWKQFLKGRNDDFKSLLHQATYGHYTNRLIAARDAIRAAGGAIAEKAGRLILLNKNTLTRQGGEGILKRLEQASRAQDMKQVRAIIDEAREMYPNLRTFDETGASAVEQLTRFKDYMKRKLDTLPMQVVDDERAANSAVDDLLTDMDGVYDLGFAPADEYKWALERTNAAQGGYERIADVWVDHVGLADGTVSYNPVRHLTTNFAGKPIVGAPVRMALKATDTLDVMARSLRSSINGAMIADAARLKFVSKTTKLHGFTKTEAEELFRGLDELAGNNASVANPRGLSATNMWEGTKGLIPRRLLGDFDQRDLMMAVLDAYDGDLRFVGATQKLTGRAKAVAGDITGVNFLGQIAEHVYPLLKFRLNAVFQLQEKIEPWVLNAQRGVHVAVGTKMNRADELTQRFFERMLQHSLVRMGDITQYEYDVGVLMGKTISQRASNSKGAIGKLRNLSASITDVQGVKRINMLRTFRKGLGKEIKGAWDEVQPGAWDDMKAAAEVKLGSLIHDDDFAIQVISENIMANDVIVERIMKAGKQVGWKTDFKAALQPGTWHAPQSLGEMRALDLDGMAGLLQFPDNNGKVLLTQADWRRAIARGDVSLDDMTNAMGRMNLDPDYIARVRSAMEFSWTGFWSRVGESFQLDNVARAQMEDWVARMASMRGMQPVDFLSQVLSPSLGGQEAVMGNLGRLQDIITQSGAVKTEQALGRLAPKVDAAGEYITTRNDLIHQLSGVISHHLDPSAKRALLMEMRPAFRQQVIEEGLDFDLAELAAMWDSEAEGWLADNIIGLMDATEGDVWAANLPRTTDQAREFWPEMATEVKLQASDGREVIVTKHAIGDGVFELSSMDAPQARLIIEQAGSLHKQFPDVGIVHIDIDDISGMAQDVASSEDVLGVTFLTADGKQGGIVLSSHYFSPDSQDLWIEVAEGNGRKMWATHYTDPDDPTQLVPRTTQVGTKAYASSDQAGTIRHEFGHKVFAHLDGLSPRSRVGQEWRQLRHDYLNSRARMLATEYGMQNDHEAFAELFDLAFNPAFDEADPQWAIALQPDPNIPPLTDTDAWLDLPYGLRRRAPDFTDWRGPDTVPEAVAQFKDFLKRNGIWKEPPVPTRNPDVVRAARWFSRFSQEVVGGAIEGSLPSNLSRVLDDLRAIPTEGAVPYNLTEQRLVTGALDSMAAKWTDAYRLQYFAQNRSMLERSINHPMFGLYPASYMWGKIAPEMIRFVAQSPFSVRTGAAAYQLADLQRAVALQREFDPEMDALIEKLGHSQTMWFLGYMLPATPWDIGSAFPSWMRDIAQQGLDNTAQVEAGGAAEGVDIYRSATKAGSLIDPLRAPRQIHAVAQELDEFINQPSNEQGVQALADDGIVQATELEDPLTQALNELSSLLGR